MAATVENETAAMSQTSGTFAADIGADVTSRDVREPGALAIRSGRDTLAAHSADPTLRYPEECRMNVHRFACAVTILAACGCGGASGDGRQVPSSGSASESSSIAGTWELIRRVKSGEEQPNRGPNGEIAVYTLAADGTFHIALGDSTVETGTWTEDTTASPETFDHIPNVDGKPGPLVPGIFAIAGDTLTVSIRPPNAEGRHPTGFRSSPVDSSWLLVYTRANR